MASSSPTGRAPGAVAPPSGGGSRWSAVEVARHGEVELAYQVTGPVDGTPLLLVAGLGCQMLLWHDGLCGELCARGFRVARFDNRDVGLSTHLDSRGAATVWSLLARPDACAAYGLGDMAADALAVLDALGWDVAHVLGCSLGGAVAQLLAVAHGRRVASLTSVMSTPSLRIGRGTVRARAQLLRSPPCSGEDAERRIVALYRVIGSPGYPLDEPWLREVAHLSWWRSDDAAGTRRQLAALLAGGDRRRGLASIDQPALVVHGANDPVFRPAAALATAEAIRRARLVVYPGMGHDLPRALWSSFADEVAALARRATG